MASKAKGAGVLPAPTPLPTQESGLAALIRGLLPVRSAEDILGGVVRLHLGDVEIPIGVLPIRANRDWKLLFNAQIMGTLTTLDEETDAAGVLRFLAGMTDTQIGLLRAYDQAGVLPSSEWVDEHVTESQLLSALLAVTAAAFPLAASLIELVREVGDLQAVVNSLRSTSPSPASTDGPPAQLKAS